MFELPYWWKLEVNPQRMLCMDAMPTDDGIYRDLDAILAKRLPLDDGAIAKMIFYQHQRPQLLTCLLQGWDWLVLASFS